MPECNFTLAMLGYFQRLSWFWLKPWLDRISRSCRFHSSAHTYAFKEHSGLVSSSASLSC